jgi:hypothetical protein
MRGLRMTRMDLDLEEDVELITRRSEERFWRELPAQLSEHLPQAEFVVVGVPVARYVVRWTNANRYHEVFSDVSMAAAIIAAIAEATAISKD